MILADLVVVYDYGWKLLTNKAKFPRKAPVIINYPLINLLIHFISKRMSKNLKPT